MKSTASEPGLTLSLFFLQIRSMKRLLFWLFWFCFVFFVCLFVYFWCSFVCLFLILSMKVLKKTEEILKFEKKTVMARYRLCARPFPPRVKIKLCYLFKVVDYISCFFIRRSLWYVKRFCFLFSVNFDFFVIFFPSAARQLQ